MHRQILFRPRQTISLYWRLRSVNLNLDNSCINFVTQCQGSLYDSHNPRDNEEVTLNECRGDLNRDYGSVHSVSKLRGELQSSDRAHESAEIALGFAEDSSLMSEAAIGSGLA